MNKGNLLIIVILVGVVGFVFSSPRLRSLIGFRSSEVITIQRGSQAEANGGAEAEETESQEAVEAGAEVTGNQEEAYELITLLPKDSIRSIDNPEFVTGAEADDQYSPDELVLGVEIDGDARAYSIPFLSGHEIVNDVVAGKPIAVTW